ncbi:glutaredoxin family protein [Deinococcus sp. KSM4-11]|uniref:glutaredoxin family protein n=1 Tax=Deinococcus sp. KSM4-11 TaxID=2568654 RepID=UPI0010A57349|nr:glutaredoxin family protein [Deinococcus sp. KSM4-11]THF88826.1 glutaredoxin family protein [Deinococcus sp. KSM4-11]
MGLPELTLYTRVGCHLCELAVEHLRALEFAYRPVDVDMDADLKARYGDDVPVLALGDRVLARGVLGRSRLGMVKLTLLRDRRGHGTDTVDA